MFVFLNQIHKMKLKFLYAFLFLSSITIAQTTKFSAELGYPLPVDKNFMGDHHKGIVDLGLKYRIKNLQVINIGISVNGALFTYSDSGYFPAYDQNLSFKTTTYLIQPRLYSELNLKKINKLHPAIGIGYTLLIANTKFSGNEGSIPNHKTNEGGINLNLGLSYDILSKIYLFTSYDYIALTQLESGVPKTTYNTKASLLKFGIGIRL